MAEINSNAPKIIALVPMRHSSERVPGKNYRLLAGKPLYAHVIEALLGCPEISGVVVDTDSPVIMQGLRDRYPRVTVLERPQNLRDGMIPMNEILLHDTAQVEADYYLQTHSTNPLLRTATITRAIRQFLDHYPEHDTLFSVTRVKTRLWDSQSHAINHDPAVLLRTQDLPPIYEENSCLYIFTRHTLETRRNRIGEQPLMFEIDRLEAWDIDDELDFHIAEFLYSERLDNSR